MLLVRGKLERQDPKTKADEVGAPTPTIHVIATELVRLDVPGRDLQVSSRDFH
jgi:hypothetical protein